MRQIPFRMPPNHARSLIDGLSDKVGLPSSIDRPLFLEILKESILYPDRYYNFLPHHLDLAQLVQDRECSHEISLRAVLGNKAFSRRSPNIGKLVDYFIRIFGGYSFYSIAHKSITPIIQRIMEDSPDPYSLLGKISSTYSGYPYDSTVYFVKTKPLLVVPGDNKNLSISSWEEANTIYQMKRLGRFQSRISLDEFLRFTTNT